MARQTKIVATLGPACASQEAVSGLVAAGMDVARLNFSHGDHEAHRRYAAWVRRAARDAGRPVALLQDIQGPKIRVGTFPGGRTELVAGQEVELRPGRGEGRDGVIYIDYPHLLEDLAGGQAVLLADGMIRLEVGDRRADGLAARVVLGGELGNQRGAAFPDSHLQTPSITDKDRRDLELGRELEVDLVAASFVRSAADVLEVMSLAGEATPVIAKIELAVAYRNLEEILRVAHGAMVARGDLGVELPLEQLPRIQMEILRQTNAAGRISITATEMLESMTHSPRPTRAEVTDVANSVLEGTDAVMLSAETATGRYAERAVRMMDSICREAESSPSHTSRAEVAFFTAEEPFPSAAARAAVQAASSLDIRTIVAFTETGGTARLLSKYRPDARIIAFTPVAETYRRMALYWGVEPRRFERFDSTDEMIAQAERLLLADGPCQPGEGVVMVAGVPPNRRASTNLVKLHRLGDAGGRS